MRNRENMEMAMATFGSFGVMKEKEKRKNEGRQGTSDDGKWWSGSILRNGGGNNYTTSDRWQRRSCGVRALLQGAEILIIKITSIAIQFKEQKRGTA